MCEKRSLGYREAHELINHAKKVHIRGKRMPKRAYYCDKCKLWHLTSSKKYIEVGIRGSYGKT